MGVRFDDYDPDDGRIDLSTGTNAHTVLSFLAENPDIGYAPKEIHQATGVPRGSVGSTLSRLQDHGLVRHKGDYWAIAEDDRLGSFVAMDHSIDAFADQSDRYAQTVGWDEDLPDLDETDSEESEA